MQQAERLMAAIGQDLFDDFNSLKAKVDADLKARRVKLAAAQKTQILNAISWRDDDAAKVVKKVHKLTGSKLDDLLAKLDATAKDLPDHGYWPTSNAGEYIEYEADSDLRDSENVPLKDNIHAYFLREVRPHVKDAWLDIASVKIGYEISFNRYFYQHKPLRDLNAVANDILELEKETEGLLKRLVSLTDEGGV
jgi:type I restriction enzyme M protein